MKPQNQFVFLSDRDDQRRNRRIQAVSLGPASPTATELVSVATPGFHKDFVISENGNLSFSKDGKHVYFGAALPRRKRRTMRRIRPRKRPSSISGLTRTITSSPCKNCAPRAIATGRSRRASPLPSGKLIQIADDTMETATPLGKHPMGAGTDNREYRKANDYEEHYQDIYLIDTGHGTRKLLAKKLRGQYTWSPSGRYLLAFDGKDWSTISVPDGKMTNLTSRLPSKFWNEERRSSRHAPVIWLRRLDEGRQVRVALRSL